MSSMGEVRDEGAEAYFNYLYETAFGGALEAIASGMSVERTREHLLIVYQQLEGDVIAELMDEAYHESQLAGVLPEDVDPSWRERHGESDPAAYAERNLGMEDGLS